MHYDNYNLHCVISIHALLAESDAPPSPPRAKVLYFYPRSPCGERLVILRKKDTPLTISIHALLAESDKTARGPGDGTGVDFYPRSPCGERRQNQRQRKRKDDFYPRSPCGERPFVNRNCDLAQKFLSTLSLRRATYRQGEKQANQSISIHALLAESDQPATGRNDKNDIFLSTLSLRRATIISQHSEPDSGNFYPRSPCGERRKRGKVTGGYGRFLSTLSLRRATRKLPIREPTALHFYPRSPCGERQVDTLILANAVLFLSTLSLRRATVMRPVKFADAVLFLSTLSLRRATIKPIFGKIDTRDFYPRSPCGERRIQQDKRHQHHEFLSTLSLRRATSSTQCKL